MGEKREKKKERTNRGKVYFTVISNKKEKDIDLIKGCCSIFFGKVEGKRNYSFSFDKNKFAKFMPSNAIILVIASSFAR